MTTRLSELLVQQRLQALAEMLPGAEVGDVHAVHQARVATRRVREALPLVASPAKGRKLKRAMRRLTRSLGPVRELDVALQMLDELAESRDVPRTAINCLRQAVRDERNRLQRHLIKAVARCDFQKLGKRALAAARKHDAAAAREGPSGRARQLAEARLRAAGRAERVRDAIDNAAMIYLPDRLHEVRIAVKKLRYSMEIVRELSGSRAMARINTLKASQDLLGRMHDVEVLIARTRAIQGSSKASSLRLSADLDRLVRRLETESRQLHGHYIAMRPRLLAICDHVIDAAEPSRRAPAA
jgi:CHAD domain-containing protein